MRALIVDDSKAMRMIVSRTLRQAGFDWTLAEAADGVEALAVIRDTRPELVLCDWNMPGMNGIELLEQLRAEGIHTRFGFVTSEGLSDMRARALAAGAEFIIVKPFTVEAVRDALAAVVR